MKKITAVLLAIILFGTQITTVLAELTREDFIRAAVENNSMPDTMDVSVLPKDENGGYIVHRNGKSILSQEDIENTFEYYHFETFGKLNEYEGTGLKEFLSENIKFPEFRRYILYYGGQEWDELSYLTGEFIEKMKEEELAENPEFYQYNLFSGVKLADTLDRIDSAIQDLNGTDITEIYDAFLFLWDMNDIKTKISKQYPYGIKTCGCTGAYISTNNGEFIIPYSKHIAVGDEFEEHKAYPIGEFFAIVNAYYEEELEEESEVDAKEEDVESSENEELEEAEEPESIKPGEEEREAPENEDGKVPEEKPVEEETAEKEFVKIDKNKIDVLLYGEPLEFPDQEPTIVNDRVLVPFRVILEALGATVGWDADTRTVTANKSNITISLKIGEKKLVKNGEQIDLDVEAQIVNGRTLVPLRAVSESFKNTVLWDGENKIVRID